MDKVLGKDHDNSTSPLITWLTTLWDGSTNKDVELTYIRNLFETYFDTQYSGTTQRVRGTVANPNGYYTNIRAQIPIFRADAALTITRIHIHGADTTPTSEMALDLKFADDLNTGGFANATVIDVCDTTNGVVTITSGFDDATVPSGKYIYWSLDAAPHADWKDFWFEIYYIYD